MDFVRETLAKAKADGMTFDDAWQRWDALWVDSDKTRFRELWDSLTPTGRVVIQHHTVTYASGNHYQCRCAIGHDHTGADEGG